MNGNQRVGQDGLSRREILVGLGTVAAGLPVAQMATAATHAPPLRSTVNVESGVDLVDDRFVSDSGRHFGSQAIHHGEQKGFQVTPISQDKASPGYQRPGNLNNPTVAALLRKVMELGCRCDITLMFDSIISAFATCSCPQ